MALAVEFRQVTKAYTTAGTSRAVLDAVSFAVPAGRFVSLMGPSGSGKSTLLHLVAGLTRPTAGDVLIGDRPLGGRSELELAELRRHQVGVVFQAFNLLPSLSAVENVALPGLIAGGRRRAGVARATALLTELGLGAIAGQRPSELSGGEQQRVALARALVHDPGLVLADEPTGSLDADSGAVVLAALRQAHDARGATVVLATHDPWAAAVADEVLLLREGRIAGNLALDDRAPIGADAEAWDERARTVLSWLQGQGSHGQRAHLAGRRSPA
jgi:putative ABC transport system ATP-binding protein